MSVNIVFISVTRDAQMYDKCIGSNSHVHAELIQIDNTEKNESISKCYNKFLDGYNYSQQAWFVFCHEDFELLEDIQPFLKSLDSTKLYGPIGAKLEHAHAWLLGGVPTQQNLGSELESNKDGSALHQSGIAVPAHTIVDTFDCQCLIVHSSLIKKHNLRFDEKLTFDLYVEAFCADAFVRHGITSELLQFKCHHWSYGKVCERYFKALQHLDRKYPRYEFPSTVGYTFGAGRTFMRRRQRALRRFLDKHCPWIAKLAIKIISRQDA